MATYDVDVVVLGLGPGGEHVASRLAEAGLDVVGAERSLVGGIFSIHSRKGAGCIPIYDSHSRSFGFPVFCVILDNAKRVNP